MKKIKLIYFGIFSLLCFFIGALNVKAWSISAPDDVSPGETFTVTISGSNITGAFSASASNGRVSDSMPFLYMGNNSCNFSVTAGSAGNVVVNVSAADVRDANTEAVVSGSHSLTVRIRNSSSGDGTRSNSYSYSNKTKSVDNEDDEDESDNNNLKSITIDGFKLSPEFKNDILEYTIEVDETTEKVTINAEAEDSNAKVDGLGEKSLLDVNTYQIVVTAENGKTKTYTLKFVFKDSNPINVKKGKKTYTVVKRKSELSEFNDYKFTTININNIEVPALYNETTKLTLVGLKYKDKVYLYRYDKKNNTYVRYIEYDFKSVKLVLFKPSKKLIPMDYKEYTIKIQGHNVKVYKLRKSSSYSLIYGMNIKNGKKSLYLYDSKEQTVQRYTSEALNSLRNINKKYYNICIGLCCGVAFLIIIILIIITKKEKKGKHIKKNIKEKAEVIEEDEIDTEDDSNNEEEDVEEDFYED